MPEWLWEGIILVVVGMGMDRLRQWLETVQPKWSTFLWSGVKNAAYLGVLYFTLTGRPISYQPPKIVTADKVLAQIVDWARSMGDYVFDTERW